MNYVSYVIKLLFRIKWWLIIGPLIVGYLVFVQMGKSRRIYKSTTTIYTGIVSGYDIESTGGPRQDWNVINNAMDNLTNIITSQTTLKNVSIRLYAQCLTYGDPEKDTPYITAATYKRLKRSTPPHVLALVDRNSEEKTLENLRNYETPDRNNHVYGLFYWSPPYFSYEALSKIKVKRQGNSDMLEISYECDDSSIVYATLVLLNEEFVKQYRDLRFGETNNVIQYFEEELRRVGGELSNMEDSLRDYNIRHLVINYDEQTKHIAALSRDFELRFEEILLNYESALKLRETLEAQIDGLQTFRNNAEFISKLREIGSLQTRISATEAFSSSTKPVADNETEASTLRPQARNNVSELRKQLAEETRSLQKLTAEIAGQKYTKEGISTTSMVSQWLDATLLEEKSKAELGVMEQRKKGLDEKYVFYSPIGSTLKRKNREINFSEQSYLSTLSALNTARLRQKNLQMTSATLKIINPPVRPVEAEPSKRKMMVMAAAACTLIFILGFFLMLELLDRTLRDKIRAERIIKGKVIGAFPGKGRFGERRFTKTYRQIASGFMCNAALNYFHQGSANVLNILSTEPGAGKSMLLENLAAHFTEAGIKVRTVSWNSDFDILHKDFLLAGKLSDFIKDTPDTIPLAEAEVILIEYPALTKSSIPRELLQLASLNLMIAPANRTWTDTDQQLFEKTVELAGNTPVAICLNFATRDVVQSFTGLMPPYSWTRRIGYQISQFGFTAAR